MLRIDENSKTLVTPEQAGFVAEAPPERHELLHLVAGGWQAFARELGNPQLHYLAAEPEPGVDMVAFDEASGAVAVVLVGDDGRELVSRVAISAGVVAAWDAQRLSSVHEMLGAAVPGESPKVVLVGTSWDETAVAAMDWLVRRHGVDLAAYTVSMVRFGSERLMNVARAFPTAEAVDPAAAAQRFFADVAASQGSAGLASAPPPGVPAA